MNWWESYKVKKLFPKEVLHDPVCINFHSYQYELYLAKKPQKSAEITLPVAKFMVDPFKGTIDEGDIIPCMKHNGYTAFYQITNIKGPGPWADLAIWDDGKEYSFKLHHIEKE